MAIEFIGVVRAKRKLMNSHPCESMGFHALLNIGWYAMGESSIAEETSSKNTTNRRVKKKTSCTGKRKSEDESDSDEEREEGISDYDSDSGESMMGVQCYKELPQPRKGMEHLWNRVNRGGLDITDNIRLHVVAVCCGDDGELYFKYYDTGRYIAGPPKNPDDYEYTLCDEMDPNGAEHADSWMQWDPVPDSTCRNTSNTAERARRCSNDKSERPPPTWKGYVVLTPEEEEQIEKERELSEEVPSQRRRTTLNSKQRRSVVLMCEVYLY